ncbi:MAG: GGDEF domain-containing protein, partial [Pseudomonadota bacterium]|nr:GGDEF domain-containing protein [Pseudomonadota bacterium]
WERGKGILSTDGELLALEGYITDITKNKLSMRQSRQRLLYDPNTGLPNVALFMDRLQWAVRKFAGHNECCFALELLELDRFDDLQSKYGAATADNVAAETARRLLGALDVHSTLSRMSDSRFGILLEQPRDLKATSKIVRQLQEQILLPIMIDDVEIYATASIGVALSSTGYESGEHMLHDAATALSRAKALGGHVMRFSIYTCMPRPRLRPRSRERSRTP